MKNEKRRFIAYLKRVFTDDREPAIKELRNELKKRRMEFYTRDDGKKTLAFVHRATWRGGKSPIGRGWSDYFKSWYDDEEDRHETLLVWIEVLGANPKASIEFIKYFITDDEKEDEEVSYIR